MRLHTLFFILPALAAVGTAQNPSFATDSEVGVWLRAQGLHPEKILTRMHMLYGEAPSVEGEDALLEMPPSVETPVEMPSDSEIALDVVREVEASIRETENPGCRAETPTSRERMLSVLDAAWNQAREGLRVIDDFVRFVLDDNNLTTKFKLIRHQLTEALSVFPLNERLEARDTQGDVGTSVSAPLEYRRDDPEALIAANFHRLQESLRSIEEFGKLLHPEIAPRVERIRYDTYTLHKVLGRKLRLASSETLGPCSRSAFRISSVESPCSGQRRVARLESARLYLLLDGGESESQFRERAESVLASGVDVVQLRDKQLSDRELVGRAAILKQLVVEAVGRPLCIMNDRPDLALLSGADGVHVGQDELTASEARELLGPDALIGVSTHSLDEARAAVAEDADYIGVGPTFPSGTKSFDEFPGLSFLRDVSARIKIPAFAIGGIDESNLDEVLATGIRRIAVGGAVLNDPEPSEAVKRLIERLR